MKKTENISLASTPVIIDSDAYSNLDKYLKKIDLKFNKDELDELKKDVEVRVLELLYEQGWKPERSISAAQIKKVVNQIGEIEPDGQDEKTEGKVKLDKKLFRDSKNGQIFGVCQGLGEYFNVDPVWLRLLFIILTFVTSGTFITVYLLAGFIIPEAKTEFNRAHLRGEPQDLVSVLSNINDEEKTQRFLKNTNNILRGITRIAQKVIVTIIKLFLHFIRFVCLAAAIFMIFWPVIFIWSDNYQKELNIFLTPLNLSEKIGFSLLLLSVVSLLILAFLGLTKLLSGSKNRYKFRLAPALFTILALTMIQLPPAVLWGKNFSSRNQDWEVMSKRYFSPVQYKNNLSQTKLNIEANGKFTYAIEFSDDNTFSLEANVYKNLSDDFRLGIVNQNEAKLTSPTYTKVLQTRDDICLTCSQARFSHEDGSIAGLITLRVPRTLKTIDISNNGTDFTVNTQFIVSPDVLNSGLISGINNDNGDYETNQFIIINQRTNEVIYPKFMTNKGIEIIH